jgi:dUTP pyrophosphatase
MVKSVHIRSMTANVIPSPPLCYHKLDHRVKDLFRATSGSACFDIAAHMPYDGSVTIDLNERVLIPTGIVFDIPEGHSVRLHPRSGLAFKKGLTLVNAEGIIDSDYVEEVFVALHNISGKEQIVAHGERIAQAEMVRSLVHKIFQTDERPERKTSRIGGFGSTGTK